MPATFILQGLTPQNHASVVEKIMQIEEIKRVLISVAFVSSGGVELIADHVRPHADKTTVFAGIRNGITSAQAMKALLEIGVDLKAVDTGSPHLVFHPKLYYARGSGTARLLVGSANLTAGGLNNNIEASLVLDLDLSAPDDATFATSFEQRLDELRTEHPTNVFDVARETSLTDLLDDPRLVDERIVPPRTVSRLAGGPGALNPVPLIKLLTKRIVSRLARRRKLLASDPIVLTEAPMAPPTYLSTAPYERLWTANNLSERDLNIPAGRTANATGSFSLDKGAMEDGFNYQSQFRNNIFKYLTWDEPDLKFIEIAQANFNLVVEGIDCGNFILTVRHDTKTDSKSYEQGNAMTRLSWGSAKPYIARRELIGRTIALSRSVDDPTRFLIEVD